MDTIIPGVIMLLVYIGSTVGSNDCTKETPTIKFEIFGYQVPHHSLPLKCKISGIANNAQSTVTYIHHNGSEVAAVNQSCSISTASRRYSATCSSYATTVEVILTIDSLEDVDIGRWDCEYGSLINRVKVQRAHLVKKFIAEGMDPVGYRNIGDIVPQQVYGNVNEDVRLLCKDYGGAFVAYMYRLNDALWTGRTCAHYKREGERSTYDGCYLENITKADVGLYVPRMHAKECAVSVFIKGKPRKPNIILKTPQTEIRLHDMVELECQTESTTIPPFHDLTMDIYWTVYGVPITRNPNMYTRGTTLVILDVTCDLRHANISCYAVENDTQSDDSDSFQIPTDFMCFLNISTPETNMVLAEPGGDAKLSVFVTANPTPTFAWYRNEDGHLVAVTITDRVQLTTTNNSSTLDILDIKPTDFGQYTILVKNSYALDMTGLILTQETGVTSISVSHQAGVSSEHGITYAQELDATSRLLSHQASPSIEHGIPVWVYVCSLVVTFVLTVLGTVFILRKLQKRNFHDNASHTNGIDDVFQLVPENNV